MRKPRLVAAAVALACTTALSGCAIPGMTMSFGQGCGLAAMDPMADGASRLSPHAQRFNTVQRAHQLQAKAGMLGYQYNRAIRKPGQLPVQNARTHSTCGY
ncbi:MAG TPA: hypothetical protein VFQ45_19935 [Longimicrobium sp.]|nr:hypothetical protein [Longimicrobium sp.]